LEPRIWEAIAQTGPDASGEVQLTEALNLLSQEQPLFSVRFEGEHYDAGDRIGYLKANLEIALHDPRLLQSLVDYLSQLLVPSGDPSGFPSIHLLGSSSTR